MATASSARWAAFFRPAADSQSHDHIVKPRRQRKGGRRARFLGDDSAQTLFEPHEEHMNPDQCDRESRHLPWLDAQCGEFSGAGFPRLETTRMNEPPGPFGLLMRGRASGFRESSEI
jgi:hypothetical protein